MHFKFNQSLSTVHIFTKFRVVYSITNDIAFSVNHIMVLECQSTISETMNTVTTQARLHVHRISDLPKNTQIHKRKLNGWSLRGRFKLNLSVLQSAITPPDFLSPLIGARLVWEFLASVKSHVVVDLPRPPNRRCFGYVGGICQF